MKRRRKRKRVKTSINLIRKFVKWLQLGILMHKISLSLIFRQSAKELKVWRRKSKKSLNQMKSHIHVQLSLHSFLKVKIKNCWLFNIKGNSKLWPKAYQTMRLFFTNLDWSASFRLTFQENKEKLRQFSEESLKSETILACVILLNYQMD